MFKTRYTDELTFLEYSQRANLSIKNTNCKLNGKLEWFEKWSEVEDEFTGAMNRKFQGKFIRCSCPDKHNCFQASRCIDGKFRITTDVSDFIESPYKLVIKRRKVA